jgi:glutamine synthetase
MSPPPPVEGSAYNVPLPQLSDDMDDAIEDFRTVRFHPEAVWP